MITGPGQFHWEHEHRRRSALHCLVLETICDAGMCLTLDSESPPYSILVDYQNSKIKVDFNLQITSFTVLVGAQPVPSIVLLANWDVFLLSLGRAGARSQSSNSLWEAPCYTLQKLQLQIETFHPDRHLHLELQLAESKETCLDQESVLYLYKVN